jgi:aerobic carbon-monoxide dehydrogenase large subunit
MLYMDIVRSPYAHAKITSIDSSEALKVPGVLAVITGKDLEAAGLAWMPTLMSDTQMVLPTDHVVYQSQEVACVVAESRYAAADGVTRVQVECEPLEPVIDPVKALEPSSPLVRPDKEKKTNHIWHWEAGGSAATQSAIDSAEVVVTQDIYIPRIHVASIETCGCVASFDRVSGKLTIWMTTQAPHAIRTVFSLVSKIPEHKIRVISPDIGGGFGGKCRSIRATFARLWRR